MTLGARIKRLLGGKPAAAPAKSKAAPAKSKAAPAKSKAAPAKSKAARVNTVLDPTRRKELIDWAVKVHRAKSPMARGMLDAALKQFRAKPPNPGDADALARLLRIYRAEADLRRLMNHREWRYLVLVGLREWLLDADRHPPPDKARNTPADMRTGPKSSGESVRRPRKTIVKR